MDEFKLTLNRTRMESTNSAWNRLSLNSKWSVGCVSELIQSRKWNSKEEWEEFYYTSGQKRLALLGNVARILNDFRMTFVQFNKQPDNLKNINFYHGRTKDDLMEKAKVLYDAVKDNGYHLTIDECYECVRFRTICQTWNGIIVAEAKCISILSQKFPQLQFVKVEGDRDYEFEIDYEVKNNGRLLLALQIKPSSYLWNTSYLREARRINSMKYRAYKEETGKDVEVVIYDKKDLNYITNLSDISQKIRALL